MLLPSTPAGVPDARSKRQSPGGLDGREGFMFGSGLPRRGLRRRRLPLVLEETYAQSDAHPHIWCAATRGCWGTERWSTRSRPTAHCRPTFIHEAGFQGTLENPEDWPRTRTKRAGEGQSLRWIWGRRTTLHPASDVPITSRKPASERVSVRDPGRSADASVRLWGLIARARARAATGGWPVRRRG